MTKVWATLLMVFTMAGVAVGQVTCNLLGNDNDVLSCSDGTTANRLGDDWSFSDGGYVRRNGDQLQIQLPSSVRNSDSAPQPATDSPSNSAASGQALGAAVATATVAIIYTITWAVQRYKDRAFDHAMRQWQLEAIKDCEDWSRTVAGPSPEEQKLAAMFKISSSQDFSDCAQAYFHSHLAVSNFRGLQKKDRQGPQLVCAVGLAQVHSNRRFGEITLADLQQEWDNVERGAIPHGEETAVLCPDMTKRTP